jgi:hypothetical protein
MLIGEPITEDYNSRIYRSEPKKRGKEEFTSIYPEYLECESLSGISAVLH